MIPQAIPGSVRSMFLPQLQELIYLLDIPFIEPTHMPPGCRPSPRNAGSWFPIRDIITVQPRVALNGRTDTYNNSLLHEIIHWTGHPSRLGRKWIIEAIALRDPGLLDSWALSTEEATAEMGSFKLAAHFGLNLEVAKNQMDWYLGRHCLADLHQAERDSDAAVTYVLERAQQAKIRLTSSL